MESQSDRLRAAREQAGFETASDACRQFGWTVSTYSGHENGSRGLRQPAITRYAQAFGISAEWLSFGTGPSVRSKSQSTTSSRGFAEPDVEPLSGAETLKIKKLSARLNDEPSSRASSMRARTDFWHLGIMRNDALMIDMSQHARNGDIVVANLVDTLAGSATTILARLIADHLVTGPNDTPIPLSEQTSVFGKVTSVIRLI